ALAEAVGPVARAELEPDAKRLDRIGAAVDEPDHGLGDPERQVPLQSVAKPSAALREGIAAPRHVGPHLAVAQLARDPPPADVLESGGALKRGGRCSHAASLGARASVRIGHRTELRLGLSADKNVSHDEVLCRWAALDSAMRRPQSHPYPPGTSAGGWVCH